MRQTYETQTDLDNERAVADKIAAAWKTAAEKLPAKMECDYMLTGNGGVGGAFIEIKCRKVASTAYPTYMLSLHKWMRLRWLMQSTGMPVFLVVSHTDGIRYLRIEADKHYDVTMGGRTDRADGQDVEPVVKIPMAFFTRLKEAKK
jgi:hypothetical protein